MTEILSEVATALKKLRQSGFEAYIIGGCVRDRLLGNTPKDYDITTSALPEETEKVFSKFRIIETGIKHGTVTVLINKSPIEITTYRIDSEYSDNRRPDSVVFTKSLREDAARRDFTMNAIASDENGNIVDYYGGTDDIKNKIIRCVGDPNERFNEDALRILRAIRFSSVLDFEIESKTRDAIFNNKELLKNISAERIASEFTKILCGKNARRVIMEYIDVIGVFIPECLPMKNFDQRNFHHIYDVLEHTAFTVENIPDEPILRLAAFFHDIGKPQTFFIENGIGHFYGHSEVGAKMAKKILSRLKYDNHTRDSVYSLVRYHDTQIEEKKSAVKRCMNKHGDIFFDLLKLKRADNLAQAPEYHNRTEYVDRIQKIAEDIIANQECFSLKQVAVNGSDLIKVGFTPGKLIGECLNDILDKIIKGELDNDKQILLDYAVKKYL